MKCTRCGIEIPGTEQMGLARFIHPADRYCDECFAYLMKNDREDFDINELDEPPHS